MLVRIDGSRIRVLLDDGPQAEAQAALLAQAIASAKSECEGDRQVVACNLSVQSLQKIKALFPASRLSEDAETGEALGALRTRRREYLMESALGDRAKAGQIIFPGYNFDKATAIGKPPFAHQRLGFQFLHAIKKVALFGDCGTGKTFMAATFIESLIKTGERWVFLIICPPNLIKHAWQADVAEYTDLRAVSLRPSRYASVVGIEGETDAKRQKTAREKLRRDLTEEDSDIYLINPENVRIARKDRRKGDKLAVVMTLLRKKKKDGYKIGLIFDESSKLKTRTSATFVTVNDIAKLCDRAVIMTGTPSPNGVIQLWPQFQVLDAGMTLQPSFSDYRADTHDFITLENVKWQGKDGHEHTATKWRQKKGIESVVRRLIEPRSIRFNAKDVLDLPEVMPPILREVEMSPPQRKMYTELEAQIFAELDGQSVTAHGAGSKMIKCREITGGFVITDDGNAVPVGADNPKVDELDMLLEQSIADKLWPDGSPSKAIIWAQFQWELKMLIERYRKLYGARGLFGGISQRSKDDAITAFKQDRSARLLVCHPQSAGHGLTLTQANYNFYYSYSFDFEELYQSAKRTVRPGQKNRSFFYFLACKNTIDYDMLDSLGRKKRGSDIVTDGKFRGYDFLARRAKQPTRITFDWEGADDRTEPIRGGGDPGLFG